MGLESLMDSEHELEVRIVLDILSERLSETYLALLNADEYDELPILIKTLFEEVAEDIVEALSDEFSE